MSAGMSKGYQGSILRAVPNLVDQLFPDDALPLPAATILESLQDAGIAPKPGEAWKGCPDLDNDPEDDDQNLSEHLLAKFLNNLGKAMSSTCEQQGQKIRTKKRMWSAHYKMLSLPGGENTYHPQLALFHEGEEGHWSKVLSHAEWGVGYDPSFDLLVHGAFNIFISQDDRRFHLGLIFNGKRLFLVIFDHGGIVESEAMDLRADPVMFVRAMAGLMLSKSADIGFDTTITMEPNGLRQIQAGENLYDIVRTLDIKGGIEGTGTVIWRVRRHGIDYVVKDNWSNTGSREAEIMGMAEDVEGVPKVVWEKEMFIGERRDDIVHVRRATLSSERWKETLEVTDLRVHRRLVMTPYAEPITSFRTKKELLSGFIDAIEAHGHLLERKILHCDISVDNIMLHRPPALSEQNDSEGKRAKSTSSEHAPRKGLLIDLDLAILTKNWEGFCRMGTKPFMSIKVLKSACGRPHLPEDDLESFFYALIWICVTCRGPRNAERPDFDFNASYVGKWQSGDYIQVAAIKETVVESSKMFEATVLPCFAPYFKDLQPCVRRLRDVLFGESVRVALPTHQAILHIFRETMASLPDEDKQLETESKIHHLQQAMKRKRSQWDQEADPAFLQLCPPMYKRLKSA